MKDNKKAQRIGGRKIKGSRSRNLIVIMLLSGRKDKEKYLLTLNKQSTKIHATISVENFSRTYGTI